MSIAEIKAEQEAALGEFAYRTGLLTYLGGTMNEPDAPVVQFPDSRDHARLWPIWNERFEQGFRDGQKAGV